MKKNLFLLIVLFSIASMIFAAETPISTVIASDTNGATLHNTESFTIRGIVTTGNFNNNGTYMSFYVQDATGGIDIYKVGNAGWYATKGLSIGSDVTILGTVSQYNGVIELVPGTIDDITVNGTGTVPTPQTITMDDLQDLLGDNQARFNMRGSLVKIFNAYLASGSPAWPPADTYVSLQIAIGSASATPTGICYINRATDIDGSTEPSWPQNITGIFNQYDSSSPFYSSFQIIPRALTDFEPYIPAVVGDWDLY